MVMVRRVAPLILLLAAQAGAVAALHAFGGQPWARVGGGGLAHWLVVTEPVEALLAVARWGALAVGWWLLASTAAAAAATLGGARGLAARMRPMTWSVARRAIDRAAAAGVSVALLAPAAPVLADTTAPPPPAVSEPDAVQHRVDAPDLAGHATHRVAPGDHLWAIAAHDLAARTAAEAEDLTDEAIAGHWRAVVEANVDSLRSGDPDLIHPGESVALPPPE